jgi:uncharacterized protein YcaQ
MSDEATGDLAEDFLQVLQAEADNTIQKLESKAARGLLKWLQAEEATDLAKQIFVWLQSEADLTNTSFGEGHFRYKLGQMLREISKEDSQSYDQLEACRRALTQCLRALDVFTESSGSRFHELSKKRLEEVLQERELLEQQADEKPVLSEAASVAYEIILELPLHRALTGTNLLKMMDKHDCPTDQSSLTSRIIPELKLYGVVNTPRKGYHIPASKRPKA